MTKRQDLLLLQVSCLRTHQTVLLLIIFCIEIGIVSLNFALSSQPVLGDWKVKVAYQVSHNLCSILTFKYDVRNNCCIFVRLFKIQKNGVFLFGISF